MICPIKRGTAQIIYAADDGVCLRDYKSGAYMLSVESYAVGEQVLALLPSVGLFTFHQGFMKDALKAKVRHETFIENVQAVYTANKHVIVPESIKIRPLNGSHFDIVIKNYDIDVGDNYLHDAISEGRLFGGYVDSCLVGFVGVHSEGSVGMLKVFDRYLNKGYGTALAGHITNHQLSQGADAFAQIGEDNKASLAVFRKLGYSISAGKVYWLF